MAFECEHCNFSNSEVQMGGMIPDKGVSFELKVAKGDAKARAHSPLQPRRLRRPRLAALPAADAACAGGATQQSLSRQVVKGDTATVRVRARGGWRKQVPLPSVALTGALRSTRRACRRYRSWTWRCRPSRSAAP
jgi:hypothetical protein